MARYELENNWECLNRELIQWIEEVVQEGWNVYLNETRVYNFTEKLANIISIGLNKEHNFDRKTLSNVLESYYPIVSNWIDKILLNRKMFYREPIKFQEFAIVIARDLIKAFLNEIRKEKQRGVGV